MTSSVVKVSKIAMGHKKGITKGLAWDHIGVFGIAWECLRSHKSVQDYLNLNRKCARLLKPKPKVCKIT